MKNLRKISSVLIMGSMLTSLCTPVNAAGTQATISEGSKNGNTVTFTITVPAGTGLRGDANNDGNVNSLDLSALIESQKDPSKIENLNKVNADIDGNGFVEVADTTLFNNEVVPLSTGYKPVELTGTVESKATLVKTAGNGGLQKVNDTTYKVEVTVPENEKGTIGVKVKYGAFKLSQTSISGELTKEFTVSTTSTPTPTTTPTTTPTGETPAANVDKTIKIADGVQSQNKITFKVTLPKESGLLGDANNDGKVTEEDAVLVEKYNTGVVAAKDINMLNADVDRSGAGKGTIELADATGLRKMLLNGVKFVTLTGTLAADAKYDFVKGTDGTYSIVVTVPTNKEGTIGAKLNKDVIIFADHTTNGEVSSKEFKVTLDSLKASDGAKTTNDGAKQAQDANAKYSKLPAAGSAAIGGTIALALGAAAFGFVKYRRIDK